MTSRALALAVILTAAPAAIRAQVPPDLMELAVLEHDVAEHPDDVDRRLRLANALAQADRRADARREALAVLAQAPDYLDAELILARLDAWDHHWPAARAHLARVLLVRPQDLEARLLAVDVGLWSGDVASATRMLATIRPAEIGEVEHWYREAQLAVATRDHRRALALARRILAVDPKHVGARGLVAGVNRISVESATDSELYPANYRDRLAIGETLTVTAFPHARWSMTLVYEYRRRYATDNHRFAARGDWRPTDRWTLIAFVRGGAVEVVPRLTTFGEASWERDGWLLGGRYTYDHMPWSGDLQRVQAMAGMAITPSLRIDTEAMGGLLSGCSTSAAVWSGRARLTWSPPPWDIAASYGRGLEADRALAGADPCASPIRDLVDANVEAFGFDLARTLGGLGVRVSYGVERRSHGNVVNLGAIAIRAWF